MGTKIVNREQLEINRKNHEELMNYLYPNRLTEAERQQLRKEYERRKHDCKNQN